MSASSKTTTGALPPSSRCTRLTSRRGAAGDLHAGPHRAGDRDHLRGRVLDQGAAGVAVAADDVEHARRAGTRRRSRPAAAVVAGVVSRRLEHDRVAGGERRARSSRPPSSSGSSTASTWPHDADRLAPDRTRCGPPCTPRRTGPRAPAPRRRRTGSGRPSAGSPRARVSALGLPVFSPSAATSSSARASIASAIFSSACCRSLGVVSRHVSKAAAAAPYARVDVGLRRTPGPWRRPRRSPG